MTPLEIGSAIGASLVASGTIIAFIFKMKKNGTNDLKEILKEQLKMLQEIRDNLLKFNYEVSNRLTIQQDKLATLSNSVTSLHERFNGRNDRTVP